MIRAFIRNARAADIRLRHAGPADAEALARVHVQAWREAYVGQLPNAVLQGLDPARRAAMWRDAMAAQTVQVQLAIQDDEIVGFGASRPQSDPALPFAGEISAIYVLRCAQRLGIGRRIMAAMAQDMLARSLPSTSLWVLETNAPARRFYAELGGVEVARLTRAREGASAVSVAYGWDDVRILI
jgi:ribosomal protein S18 acetylase RimI-like enzyme